MSEHTQIDPTSTNEPHQGHILPVPDFIPDYENPELTPDDRLAAALAELYATRMRLLSTEEQLSAARTDVTTGLPNQSAFENDFPKLFDKMQPGRSAMVFGDVKGLKSRNDQAGHGEGTGLIRSSGETMMAFIPPEFTSMFDLYLARIGGDEFAAIVVDNRSDEEVAQSGLSFEEFLTNQAREITTASYMDIMFREMMGNMSELDGTTNMLALGVAIKTAEDTPESLLTRADHAAEQVKRAMYDELGEDRRIQ